MLRARSGSAPAALAAALLMAALAPLMPGALALFDGRFDGYQLSEITYQLVALDAPEPDVLPDDNMTEALDMGFTSRYFDDPVSQFWVGSNGFLSVFKKELAGCCEGQALPDPNDPDGLVAGFWTDLHPDEGGSVRHQKFTSLERPGLAAQKGIVAEWRDVPGPGGSLNTFQVAFLEDGTADIIVAEAHVPAGARATIGGENHNGTVAVPILRSDALDLAERSWRMAPIYTPLIPDLVLDGMDVVRPPQPDLPWTITVHLRNDGVGPITQAKVAVTAVPLPGPLRGTSPGCPELVGSKFIFDIKSGEAAEVQFTWPAPVSFTAPAVPRLGEYRFDAAGTVLQAPKPEVNLTNNLASGQGAWLVPGLGGTDVFCQQLPVPVAGGAPRLLREVEP